MAVGGCVDCGGPLQALLGASEPFQPLPVHLNPIQMQINLKSQEIGFSLGCPAQDSWVYYTGA
ncbi:predicted protein [Histoplasma capsulatum H143]|uniref:Uncharacterized protein n=1 Tax=Ajellomyces capsulatus (strain H143) TaxID=544712 RepID=C6HL50_AJECH|nr:predicted protein [Histoplasma capsulatum H143]